MRSNYQPKNSQSTEATLEEQILVKTNRFCVNQLTQLDLKVKELNYQIQERDNEITKIKRSLTSSFLDNEMKLSSDSTRRSSIEYSGQVTQFDTPQFRPLKTSYNEISQLRAQLQQANNLKDVYEKKYKDLTVSEDLSESMLAELEEQLEDSKREIENHNQNIYEYERERDYLKKEVIPVLERTLHLYEQNKLEMEEELAEIKSELRLYRKSVERKRTDKPEDEYSNQTLSLFSELPPRNSASTPSSKVVNKKATKTEISFNSTRPLSRGSVSKNVSRTPRAKTYIPSYTRHKKSATTSARKASSPETNVK